MSELNLNYGVELPATQVSAVFPHPKMNSFDAHELMAEDEMIDSAKSCSDGCGVITENNVTKEN